MAEKKIQDPSESKEVPKEVKSKLETPKDEETVSVPKSVLESIQADLEKVKKDRDMLLNVADKKALAHFYDRNRGSVPKSVKLRLYAGKLVIRWETIKLKDICDKINYGYTTSAVTENTGIKYLRITDIVNAFIDWDSVPFCKVSEIDYEKYKVEDGDIGLNTSLGHPQGTFKLHDFVTTPTMLRVALEMYQASNDPRMYPPLLLMRMVKNGEWGASSGKGFYDWTDPRNPKARDLSRYVVGTAEDMTQQVN